MTLRIIIIRKTKTVISIQPTMISMASTFCGMKYMFHLVHLVLKSNFIYFFSITRPPDGVHVSTSLEPLGNGEYRAASSSALRDTYLLVGRHVWFIPLGRYHAKWQT